MQIAMHTYPSMMDRLCLGTLLNESFGDQTLQFPDSKVDTLQGLLVLVDFMCKKYRHPATEPSILCSFPIFWYLE